MRKLSQLNLKIIADAKGDREEWLKVRSRGIGGSDAGAIMGVNKWSHPSTLWKEKCGLTPPTPPTIRMRCGSYLEAPVREMVQEIWGIEIETSTATYQHPDHPFMLANIDGYCPSDESLIEIKTSMNYSWKEIPEYYEYQILHYLAVTGLQRCRLFCLFRLDKLQEYEVNRDDEKINALIEKEREFWQAVVSQTPIEVVPYF